MLESIIASAGGTALLGLAGIVFCFLLSRIDVAKVQINPWKWLRSKVGEFFGFEHEKRLDTLEKRFNAFETLLKGHIADSNRRDADRSRRRILDFERELQFDVRHSKEDFEDVLATIKHYNGYCKEHPEYENNITVESAEHIREVYRDRLRKHDFEKGVHYESD